MDDKEKKKDELIESLLFISRWQARALAEKSIENERQFHIIKMLSMSPKKREEKYRINDLHKWANLELQTEFTAQDLLHFVDVFLEKGNEEIK